MRDDEIPVPDHAPARKSPWWVVMRSFRGALLLMVLWASIAVLNTVLAANDPSALRAAVALLNWLIAAAYVPTIVYFLRNKTPAAP
jgi:hypothetical protein